MLTYLHTSAYYLDSSFFDINISSQSIATNKRVSLSESSTDKHLPFAYHIPIPTNNNETVHDSNQRMALLYGVGKKRQEQLQRVRQVRKDLTALFNFEERKDHVLNYDKRMRVLR